MPQISILLIPLRSHTAFSSPVSTLIREYLPKDTLANPELSRHASTILYTIVRDKCGDGSAGFEPPISCLKWGRCPSYPDSTWEIDPDGMPLHHPTLGGNLNCRSLLPYVVCCNSHLKFIVDLFTRLRETKYPSITHDWLVFDEPIMNLCRAYSPARNVISLPGLH